jgi:hypothetical protein
MKGRKRVRAREGVSETRSSEMGADSRRRYELSRGFGVRLLWRSSGVVVFWGPGVESRSGWQER